MQICGGQHLHFAAILGSADDTTGQVTRGAGGGRWGLEWGGGQGFG